MDLRNKGDAFPSPFDGVEPNIVEMFRSVVMNVEITDLRVEARWRCSDVNEGGSVVPRRNAQ